MTQDSTQVTIKNALKLIPTTAMTTAGIYQLHVVSESTFQWETHTHSYQLIMYNPSHPKMWFESAMESCFDAFIADFGMYCMGSEPLGHCDTVVRAHTHVQLSHSMSTLDRNRKWPAFSWVGPMFPQQTHLPTNSLKKKKNSLWGTHWLAFQLFCHLQYWERG